MHPNNNIIDAYNHRLFEKNKNFIPKDDFPWFYLKQFLPENKNTYFLDAGCGSGKYCERLIALGYKNVFGIDLLNDNQYINCNFNYQRCSIDNTMFHNDFFDIIFANSVIYHLDDINKGISELQRIIKKNGILILTGHTRNSLFTFWRKIKLLFNIKSVQNLKYAKFKKTSEYINLLKENGFNIIKQDGYYISFILYPFYRRKSLGLRQRGFKLPLLKPKFSRFKILAKLKSNFGYHFVIISRKI